MTNVKDPIDFDSLPATYRAWQLHGAGLESVGTDGAPDSLDLRPPKDNEILMRVEAVGLCLSDMKIIKQGSEHVRLRGRDLSVDPTVLGHECALTAVAVGARWKEKVVVGQRYAIQPDIYYKGVGDALGYIIPGALAEYLYIDERVMEGDEGCYLMAMPDTLGASQVALAEPWACVDMSYCGEDVPASPGEGAVLVVTDTDIPETYDGSTHVPHSLEGLDEDATFDDIIVHGPQPESVETLAKRLNKNGVMFLVGDTPLNGTLALDFGRIHYEGIRVYGGGSTLEDIAQANARHELKEGGAALFVGAGGPMGQMHVQRAIQMPGGPRTVIATDLEEDRLAHLQSRFGPLAKEKGVQFLTFSPAHYATPQELDQELRALAPDGYNDICILVPVPRLVTDFMPVAADNAVINIFAGVGIGSFGDVELSDLCRGVKLIGTSGSRLADLVRVLDKVQAGHLDTNLSVAAIGGLNVGQKALGSLADAEFPGKIIIYPHLHDLPLTALPDVPTAMPEVGTALDSHGAWSIEAEKALTGKGASQ
jgi:threonine dehydrogenase-like Zn-dependent dehydrogenase